MLSRDTIKSAFEKIQDNICHALEQMDGTGKFQEDFWVRDGGHASGKPMATEGGGGGRTRVLEKGTIIEKGGVNFSAVHGELPKALLDSLNVETTTFFASGVSIVLHPVNPMVPIIHMNIRYFEMGNGKKWFGGGIDLTPHYIDFEDAKWFHSQLKNICDQFNSSYYPEFKNWADEYFYIKHRNETRGIGGIFIDHLTEKENFTLPDRFNFVQAIGNNFAPIYVHLAEKSKAKKFSEKEKEWQLLRRGRYVEFNLVYDRGTKFGLETGGRTESILMSLPELASWKYNFQTIPESPEEFTSKHLKKGIDWINFSEL